MVFLPDVTASPLYWFCKRRNCRRRRITMDRRAGHRTATMKSFTALFVVVVETHAAENALATCASRPCSGWEPARTSSACWSRLDPQPGCWSPCRPAPGRSDVAVKIPARRPGAGVRGLGRRRRRGCRRPPACWASRPSSAPGHRRRHADRDAAVAEPGAGGRPTAFERLPRVGPRHRQLGSAVRGWPAGPASLLNWGYAPAALGAAVALACIIALPKAAAPTRRPAAVDGGAIQAGARFVVRHELLRGVSLCAIFWNSPFSPCSRLGTAGARPAQARSGGMGLAQSAYGAGLILGALMAPISSKRLPPLATLIFGPAVSVRRRTLPARTVGQRLRLRRAGDFLIGFGRCCG